jgi:transposase InsO family protein
LQYEKQEKIYLNAYENGAELYAGLMEYMVFYNEIHPHQSLDYQIPAIFYKKNCAIVWKFVKKL